MTAPTKTVTQAKPPSVASPTQATASHPRRTPIGAHMRRTVSEAQRLQKGSGNHAVSQAVIGQTTNPPATATGLTVNQPGDIFERQADRVAGSVVGSHSPPPRRGAAAPPVTPVAAAAIRQPEPGRPLSPDMRGRLELSVGADLGQVRIHEGAQAAVAAASLSARAFTAGNHIFLGAGESSSDARLMAHETTHVAQQQKGGTPAIQRTEDEGVLATAWAYTGGAAIEAGAELASEALEFTADTAWSIVEELAPQLAQLIRDVQAAGGVFDYLKNLLGGVLDSLFSGVGEDSGVLEGFLGTFDALLAASQEILEPLLAGDCDPLFAAVGRLQETISQMAGDAWNAIVEFFQPVGEFFSDLWTDFGAPVVDWIGEVAGDIWQDIQDIASDIWEWTQPVRDAFTSAWEWVKEQLGIGSDTEDSEGGLLAWVQQKLGEAWDAILELLEPVIAPIRGVIDQVMAVLPLDAILNLRETVQGWLENASSMVQTMEQPDGVAAQQTTLRDEILPAVLATVASLREGIVNAGIWVANVVGSVVEQVNSFMAALSANSLVSHLVGLLQWVSDGVASLGQWAQETVVSLFGFIGDGLVYLSGFIEPILNLLQQLISVLSDLLGQLPNLITGGLWGAIPECITEPIKNFLIENILSHIPIFSQLLEIPDIWARISAVAMRILRQVFVDGNLFGAAWTFFSALLELLGIPPQLVTNILRNAINVFSSILQDPVGFLINLLRAVKEGFIKFFGNIGRHLLDGVMGWLFGQVQEAGLTPPTEFSLRSILGFVLQILDITTERIFQRMEQNPRIGPERVALLRRALAIAETAWGWITTLINEGPGGLWRQLQERLSDLWQTVLTSVISWITTTIITTASARLLSLLDPTGIMAVVNSLIAIYRAIESFMQYLRQMLEVVNSVLEGVAGIARGAIEQAASFLESALARALPIAIGFLANQVGLGGISSRIREMVENVRQLVDRAIDWLIERALNLGQAILNALGLGGGAAATAESAPADEVGALLPLPVDVTGENHTLRVRTREDGMTILEMSSEGWGDFPDRMRQVKQRQVQRLQDNGEAEMGERLSTEMDALIANATAAQNRINTIPRARIPERLELWEEELNELEIELDRIAREFSFDAGIPINVGDEIVDISRNVTLIVQDVRVRSRADYGIQAAPPDNPRAFSFFSYDAYNSSWGPVGPKPAYRGFGISGSTRTVRITSERLVKGPRSDPSFRPPGYDPNGNWNRRGHLIAHVFTGPYDARNIVAMTYNANHTGAGMRGIEEPVQRDIEGPDDAVYEYAATPVGGSATAPPDQIQVTAQRVYPTSVNPAWVPDYWLVDNR